MRMPRNYVGARTHTPPPILTGLRGSASAICKLLIGGAIVAGVAYIFAFDSSPDIDQRSVLMATFSEMPSHSYARYLQSSLSVAATGSSLGASPPDVGKMSPVEPLPVAVNLPIERLTELPQRLGRVPEPPDRILPVESEPQIIHRIPQTVPLPRAYPKIRPKPATTAPVQTSKLSSLAYNGIARDSAPPRPGAKPKLTATATSNQAPPTAAPSVAAQSSATAPESAQPPAASNWWRELLTLFETP